MVKGYNFWNPVLLSADDTPMADFHIHTNWTDGKHSVVEMHDAAVALGLEKILFSEHARKTSTDWFHDFAAEVRDLPSNLCQALVGVECKVEDFEGNIDTAPEIIAACDLVMVSVHRFPNGKGGVHEFSSVSKDQALDIEFQLSWEVLSNPNVDILGHPFGMSCQRFSIDPPDDLVLRLAKRAAEYNVAFEINSHYHAKPWRMIEICREADAPISLGSNAHSKNNLGEINRMLKGLESL
jgi:putative hydrolase